MQVNKRNGSKESVSFDKITKRISDLCFNLEYIDPISVAKDTINALYDGITTRELDILSADICATKAHHYPDYNKLGGRILSSNITKETLNEYKDVVKMRIRHRYDSSYLYYADGVGLIKKQKIIRDTITETSNLLRYNTILRPY